MSTRKLILWALLCGVLILAAGTAKLFQTSQKPVEVQLLALGESVTLGDMTVSVTALRDTADRTLVDVTMVGVAEAQAMDGWKMLAAGEVSDPVILPVGAGTECTLTKLAETLTCTVAFPVSEGTRTVAYIRAGEQRQWATAP
ncbi:unannotated protein [freshwater metagenome]|jgi:hypothetical protein|uniref:Unannotated protein n=1 Tax=freshwater metagenome TaxID=449393 RepID=A0A6J7LAH1_9ZZZZ|nr:hypothetical protein [Actinomycetota bacterium]